MTDYLQETDEQADRRKIALDSGRVAHREGKHHRANPYEWPKHWREHCAWNTGYMLAQLESIYGERYEPGAPPVSEL